MADAVGWVLSHLGEIGAVIGALLSIATVVTAFTSTPKDDEWVRRIAGWLSFLTHKDQTGTVKAPLTSARKEPPLMGRRERLDR